MHRLFQVAHNRVLRYIKIDPATEKAINKDAILQHLSALETKIENDVNIFHLFPRKELSNYAKNPCPVTNTYIFILSIDKVPSRIKSSSTPRGLGPISMSPRAGSVWSAPFTKLVSIQISSLNRLINPTTKAQKVTLGIFWFITRLWVSW